MVGRLFRHVAYAGLATINVVCSTASAGPGRLLYRITKLALMPTLAWAVRPTDPRVRTALGASAVGDAAMMVHTNTGLLGGMASFAVAHAAYLRALLAPPAPDERTDPVPARSRDLAVAAAWLAVTAVAASLVHRSAGPDDRSVVAPAAGYGALVAGMGAASVRAALADDRPRLAVGGLAFVVSDALVAVWKFGRPQPATATVEADRAIDAEVGEESADADAAPGGPPRWLDPLIMATYCLAQWCLASGLTPPDTDGRSR